MTHSQRSAHTHSSERSGRSQPVTRINQDITLSQVGQYPSQTVVVHPEPANPVRSLYIHVPFCFHKCHYCDFYSIVDQRGRQEAFTARLLREIRAIAPLAAGAPLRTIFVGGGTPTLLRVDLWKQLLEGLARDFDLSNILGGQGEFSVECNPETASDELFASLVAGGVNRLSLGAQSFDTRHLKTLERWHDPARVEEAVDRARRAGIERISIDLIYAIPGQTLEEWESDLRTALSLGTSHLSCYNLTYEPNTAMTKRLERGEFEAADEDREVEMFERTESVLHETGLNRYEVSNYARAGHECLHNLAYWRQEDWLAAGPSASAHVAGHRWKNVPRLDSYLNGDHDGRAVAVDHEPPDPMRSLCETIMMGIRLREGLNAEEIRSQAESLLPESGVLLMRAAAEMKRDGWLEALDDRWVLTRAGFLFADGAARRFLDVLS